MRVACVFISTVALIAGAALAAAAPDDPVFLLRLTNDRELLVSGLAIDAGAGRVSYQGVVSGLRATFPLTRLHQVVAVSEVAQAAAPADIKLGEVLYTNPLSLLRQPDDGGIPTAFYVVSTSVGSAAGRAGGRTLGTTAGRSSGTSLGGSSGATSGRTSGSGRSSSPAGSRSSSDSSLPSDNPFSRIFTGK